MLHTIENNYQTLVTGIKKRFEDVGKKSAILGLSGGLDSAVALCLAVDSLGKEQVHGLIMPSPFSTVHSVTDAVKIAEQEEISYHIIPIDSIYYRFIKELTPALGHPHSDLADENLQARIRFTLLMAYADKKDYLLLNTTNKTELAMGSGTLYKELAGVCMVLADLYKTEVYELATFLNIDTPRIPVSIMRIDPLDYPIIT